MQNWLIVREVRSTGYVEKVGYLCWKETAFNFISFHLKSFHFCTFTFTFDTSGCKDGPHCKRQQSVVVQPHSNGHCQWRSYRLVQHVSIHMVLPERFIQVYLLPNYKLALHFMLAFSEKLKQICDTTCW